MSSKLVVSSSPHMRDSASTQKIMLDVILAMLPALIASVVIFGVRSLILVVTCVASCVLFEYLFRLLVHRNNTIGDLSAVVTGMLLAFNLPVTFPIWMAVIGSFVAIVVVKQLFGGIGKNFANPALTARIVLLISFTQQMTNYVVPNLTGKKIELVAGATPLSNPAAAPGYLGMFFGLKGGCIGETCAFALLLGFLYMVVRKVISPIIPCVYVGTVFLLSWALGADPLFQILSGGLMLGAIFMATDYVTSPTTRAGKWIFALGCGIITVLLRLYSSSAEGVSYAILLMNILTPHIDTLTRTKPFGGKKA